MDKTKELEKVRAFDEKLTDMYDYEVLINQFLWIFLVGISAFLMVLPVEKATDGTNFIPIILFAISVELYMQPYLQIRENGEKVSIYTKLKWMPVSKRSIQAVRMEYLNRFCLRLTAASVFMHVGGAVMSESFGMVNLIYPLFACFLAWLGGVVYIQRVK